MEERKDQVPHVPAPAPASLGWKHALPSTNSVALSELLTSIPTLSLSSPTVKSHKSLSESSSDPRENESWGLLNETVCATCLVESWWWFYKCLLLLSFALSRAVSPPLNTPGKVQTKFLNVYKERKITL